MEEKQSHEPKKRKRKRKRGVWKRVLLALTLICLSCIFFGAAYIFSLDAWNEFEPERITDPVGALLVYDSNGDEVSCLFGSDRIIRIPIDLESVPDHVQKAFISAEDARFYEHIGVDFIRILGAAWEDIKAGAYVQGASTISQQLIKLSHLSNEKVLSRKVEEAILAYRMEQQFSKDEILEMYLNYVYFGGGYYGIEAAARGYFGVSASELTIAQGALLAGTLKAPSNYAPHLEMENSISRRNIILGEMLEYGYIDQSTYEESKVEEVVLSSSLPDENRGYYIDYALTQVTDMLDISMDELLTGGYRIHTALDSQLQSHVEAVIADGENFPEEAQDAQAAAVVVDAQNSLVVAMVGGRESTAALAYNRATDIRRQPGSVIKPILSYAPALEYEGYTTVSMILDEPTDFGSYSPSNYGSNYHGWVTMREAVLRSLNIPAVKVFSDIGVDTGIEFAKSVGIEFSEDDDHLALALGGFAYGVSPYQIAGAYAAFASGGYYDEPTLIVSVTDSSGNILYEKESAAVQVMSEGNAYILTSMLESAVDEGTGKKLNDLPMDLAAKTGTSGSANAQGNRDAWMAAYNSEYAIAVWMGYDDDTGGRALPASATGGTYPARITESLFSKIYEDEAAPAFSMPDDVASYRLDGHTLATDHVAVLANGLTPSTSVLEEVFVVGTEPTDMSRYWVVPYPPQVISGSIGINGYPEITFEPIDAYVLYRLYREDSQGGTVQLGEWPGSLGSITHTDSTAAAGEEYEYYVIPVHPQLQINGQSVTGAASRKVKVTTSLALSPEESYVPPQADDERTFIISPFIHGG